MPSRTPCRSEPYPLSFRAAGEESHRSHGRDSSPGSGAGVGMTKPAVATAKWTCAAASSGWVTLNGPTGAVEPRRHGEREGSATPCAITPDPPQGDRPPTGKASNPRRSPCPCVSGVTHPVLHKGVTRAKPPAARPAVPPRDPRSAAKSETARRPSRRAGARSFRPVLRSDGSCARRVRLRCRETRFR